MQVLQPSFIFVFILRKIAVGILTVLYLLVTTGVVVNYHYCMNRLASTQFYAAESKQCGKCGMHISKSHGCCHDEVKVYKLDDDQQAAYQIGFSLTQLSAPVAELSVYLCADFFNTPVNSHWYNHSPPLLSGQDTYLQNRVFRI
ncbi:MAG: hypothetical protein BGO54_12805 [Sphingobacteriales bacterium 46-32]|nr:MAG: hypothetical protein BGO54_12805 [Sphingobacteriales bacterium 46-32]